ncbi:hypothetical protein Esi_0000_0520 [Ectocarpus siliculosus]|uniref:BART domain-containing protein n=1 Tax=Ectocarpus siliculosus TaxID=2880 RepID=D8LBK8_ECTSI|nr:hypothetical protein Esi_0000_0520 [Ectocarpus siliculosus]|eukprot:CBN76717.1 hypothetical protein Esi_0000_0520 [Ectocarpus siliculosus]
MAEPKDDPDAAHFMDKIANHLGNSCLEENLNDFLEQHSEELVLELRRVDSSRSPVEQEGLEHEAKREELGGEKQEEASMARGEGAEGYQDGDGHFSQRVHELYQEFLKILQSNLEEFLQAEGLTETQLRDACEKEMRAKGGRGDCFMHTLISSWEFSSFIALVSDFAAEGMGSEDEEEEEDGEDDIDGDGASVDAARSFTYGSRLDDGAGSFDDMMSGSREAVGERRLLRSHNRRCPRSDRSSSSSGNSSGRSRRSPSPPAAGAAPDDALAGRGAAVVACSSRNLSDGAKDGAAGVRTEQQRRPDGSGRAGDGDTPGGSGSKARIHSDSRRGSKEAVSCCDDAYRGDDGTESQRAGGSARIEAGVGPGMQELSMRAEAKC